MQNKAFQDKTPTPLHESDAMVPTPNVMPLTHVGTKRICSEFLLDLRTRGSRWHITPNLSTLYRKAFPLYRGSAFQHKAEYQKVTRHGKLTFSEDGNKRELKRGRIIEKSYSATTEGDFSAR